LADFLSPKSFEKKIMLESGNTLQRLGCDVSATIAEVDAAMEEKYKMKFDKNHISYFLAVSYQARKYYDLEASAWNPSAGVAMLVEQLNQTGPLVASGYIGLPFFMRSSECVKDSLIEKQYQHYQCVLNPDRTMGYWTHYVLIVGAEINKQNKDGLIYFMDPLDKSKPDEPRKIYSINYKAFTNCLVNLDSLPQKMFGGACALAIKPGHSDVLLSYYQHAAERLKLLESHEANSLTKSFVKR
jgi:hypothetical protein